MDVSIFLSNKSQMCSTKAINYKQSSNNKIENYQTWTHALSSKQTYFILSIKLIFISCIVILLFLYITNTGYHFFQNYTHKFFHVCSHTIYKRHEQWQHLDYFNICVRKCVPEYTSYQQRLRRTVSGQPEPCFMQCAYL